MKRIILLWALMMLNGSLQSTTLEPVIAIDKLATHLNQKKAYSAGCLQSELYPLHPEFSPDTEIDLSSLPVTSRRISFFNAFQRFVRIFLILLNNQNQKMQSTAKTIEVMLVNLVQIALQAIQVHNTSQETNSHQEVAQQILHADPALKNAFIITINRGVSTYNPIPSCKDISRCCCEKQSKKMDTTTQVVLKNFALIASYFINILQDPEDPDTVTPNLIGMLEGIVNIGTEVIRSGTLDINTNEEEIADYVHTMNHAAKEELMRVIYKTVQRSYHE